MLAGFWPTRRVTETEGDFREHFPRKADIIVAAALEKGHEMKFAPLTVAVLDAGGHLVAFKRRTAPASSGTKSPRESLRRHGHGLRLPRTA